jgi:hypothetical protein
MEREPDWLWPHLGDFGFLTDEHLEVVMVPAWVAMVLFGLLPFSRAFLLIRRRQRTKSGLCAACGYDLRATPQRCSECGAVPAHAEAAEAAGGKVAAARSIQPTTSGRSRAM